MSTPAGLYKQYLRKGDIARDLAQEHAVESLQRVYQDLSISAPNGWRKSLFHLLGKPLTPPRGAYLWGDVGRGKTFLMDLFYETLPFEDKLRKHFHRFMGYVHENLKERSDQPNPLQRTANKLAKQTRIICLDELFITDIADAMILGNLFSALFDRGVALVATSNVKPNHLYQNGLQRQQFLPAIEMIMKHMQLVHVDGNLDYRLQVLEQANVYQSHAGEAADRELAKHFEATATNEEKKIATISVLGRTIPARRVADGVIWFDFSQICDGPRNYSDYIEISRCYQTVLVSNVPQFNSKLENQARRFISLVDEFYDRRVKLMLSASVSISALYQGNRLKLEFKRTTSRLEEMQSLDYLSTAHIP